MMKTYIYFPHNNHRVSDIFQENTDLQVVIKELINVMLIKHEVRRLAGRVTGSEENQSAETR